LSLYDTYLFEDLATMKTQVHWRHDAPHRHVQRRDDSLSENSRMHAGQDITECNSHTDVLFDLMRHSVLFRRNVQNNLPSLLVHIGRSHVILEHKTSSACILHRLPWRSVHDMPDLPLRHVRSMLRRRSQAIPDSPRLEVVILAS
jgi:hypothetical protein